MWEQFIKCLSKAKGGATPNNNKCKFLNLSDIYNRVPPNQRKHFKLFKQKNEEYKARMERYPPSLPKIDWKYYQTNVRPEYVTWVKHFQDQYEQFDTFFENRHALVDPSKYFCEVQEEKKEMKKRVEEYKKKSNERIKELEIQLKRLTELMPYDQMTMEEFCHARPDMAPDFVNKPTFWPHTPEEQTPGPSQPDAVEHEESEVNMTKPKNGDPKGEPPKTPPDATKPQTPNVTQPSTPPSTPPSTGGKPETPKDSKPATKTETPPSKTEPESKDAQEMICKKKEETSQSKISTENVATGESQSQSGSLTKATGSQEKTESPIDVEKMKETAAELASKGSAIVMDLAQKATAVIKVWIEKLSEKRKEVEVAANKAREDAKKKKVENATFEVAKTKVDPKEVDSIYFREGSKNICHQTIIKGEDETNVEVKPIHANLNEEFEDPKEDEDSEVKYKKKSGGKPIKKEEIKAIEKKAQKENETPCQRKSQEKTGQKDSTRSCDLKASKEKSQDKESEEDMPCLKLGKPPAEDSKTPEDGSCSTSELQELKEKVIKCLEEQDRKEKDCEATKKDDKSDESQCLQTFLEKEQKKDNICDAKQSKPQKSGETKDDPKTSEKKDPEKCSLNLETSSFESPKPVDLVGTPTTPNKTQSQSDSTTKEKALLNNFDSPGLEKSVFLGQDMKSKDEDTKFTFDEKSKFLKDQMEEELEEENEDDSKLNPDKKVTVYPKLMIHAKSKDEEESPESSKSPLSSDKPPSPPAKQSPSFISQPSATPIFTPESPLEKTNKTSEVLLTAQEMAKMVFSMATSAATHLSDATNAIEEAKKEKSTKVENLEAAYLAAQKQADRALAEAYKAIRAAKKLTKRSRRNKEDNNNDSEDLVMTEKHAMLAKLLARRAIALKKEIANVLQELKDKH